MEASVFPSTNLPSMGPWRDSAGEGFEMILETIDVFTTRASAKASVKAYKITIYRENMEKTQETSSQITPSTPLKHNKTFLSSPPFFLFPLNTLRTSESPPRVARMKAPDHRRNGQAQKRSLSIWFGSVWICLCFSYVFYLMLLLVLPGKKKHTL